MSNIKNTQIDGDVSVGRDVHTGGNASIQGSATIGHNLVVKGWLDAKNIKGPNKGFFTDPIRLREAFPHPHEGWWALVGSTFPADIYIADGGEWVNSGEKGGEPTVELETLTKDMEKLQTSVDSALQETAALIDTILSRLGGIERKDQTQDGQIDVLQKNDTEKSGKISANSTAIVENKNEIQALNRRLTTLLNENASNAIDNYNEIVKFLNGVGDDESLTNILTGLNTKITELQDKALALGETPETAYPGDKGRENAEAIEGLHSDIYKNELLRFDGQFDGSKEEKGDGGLWFDTSNGKFYSGPIDDQESFEPTDLIQGSFILRAGLMAQMGGRLATFDGKKFVECGGSGSGSGFYNLSIEQPLESGFYTKETAVAALADAGIDDEAKPGMIITFESGAGKWEDYRFIGTDISTFVEPSAWEEYGGKGAIKRITVSCGAETDELTPDKSGNVNLDIPAVEVDETIDEKSTNPVQNKAVAAEFKGFAGKYGAALRLNTIGEGDEKAFSLSLLTEEGEELNTTETFTGGGGGSVVTTKITLTRLTQNPTVKNGDTVELSYKYDQVDTTTGESTGNSAKATVTVVRGATSSSFESTIPAGSTQKIDVTKYLGIGTNNVRVRVEAGDGEEKQVASISWTVNVVQLTLTSSFNIATVINKGDRVNVPYALTGSGTKTLRCYIDGVDAEDRSIATSTANGSFQIDTSTMSHGAHSIQMVAELELSDESAIKSNSIYFDIAVRDTDNTAPIIATRFDYQDGTIIGGGNHPYIPVKQYANYTLAYVAYNPRETPAMVEVYEASALVSSAKVSFITTKLNLRAMNHGTSTCRLVCGTTEYLFNLNVTKSDLNLVEPTDGMLLKLTAQGRSNSDTNREEWTYGDAVTEFSGFNWGGNGWIGNALRHTGKARSVVRYKPLEQPMQNADNAFAYLVKYKVSEVVDDSVPLISCVDEDGTGFVITPTEARMMTRGNSQLVMKMASGNIYEVGFVSLPKASDGSSDYEKENTEMVYLYINGKMSGSVQRGTSDNIYQSNPSYIQMGAEGATLDVYLMRGYNSFLTDDQMLSCFILDQDTVDELFAKYNSNDILDDNGNVSVDSVPDGMRVVIITGKQPNGVPTVLQAAITNNKKTKFDVDEILTFVKNGNPLLNFRLIGGCIFLQGTSSLAYPMKNYDLYTKNTAGVYGQLYIGCDEQGIGGTLQDEALFSFRLPSSGQYAAAPVNCWCLKADYAESSSSHNTGMARIVQDTLVGIGDLVPPQKYVDREKYRYDVRTTVDGEPCLLFYRGTVDETPQFLGKYNWNNDKSTEAVFGFLGIPGYHDQAWVEEKFGGENPTECWEFLNNDYPMGMFLDDDFDAKGEDGSPDWLKVFEARFPDNDDKNAEYEAGTRKPQYLEAVVKWVRSTDTTADGLSDSERTARAKKFRDELGDYFDVDYLCDYYEFTDIFACVDQRVKNMMMAFWYSPDADRMLAYMIFYDNDTILGLRNDGRLKYNWDVDENTIDTELSTAEKTVYAYAGHDSVLWKNLREQFPEELKAAYRRIRVKLTDDVIFKMFDKEQSEKFCERIYNLDAINKYVIPKTIGIEVNKDGVVSNVKYSYLEAMQGSRTAHRHWFVTNRMGLFDAWASTGQYTATDISFKGNSAAGATVRAVAAREFYFEFRREGETMTHDKVSKDEQWSYTYNQVANIGTIFHLLGGAWMKKLDLSDWGGFTDINIPVLPILKELILGSANKTYALTELVIDTKLPMLEALEIANYVNLPSLDLSGCTSLMKVNATGCTAMATMTFAQGAPLNSLRLPSNYQTLTLRSLPEIKRTGITFDNIRSITGLWIENCAQLDGLALLKELFSIDNRSIKYVRLPGLKLEGDGSDLKAWYDAGLGGIDAQGNLINGKCKIAGDYQLTSYLDEEVFDAYVERFDELNIRQPEYTVIKHDMRILDGTGWSNLDNKTGYDYDNEYTPSAHVSKILSSIHRCCGKFNKDGGMTICLLHDKDSNYYADADSVSNATPSVLTGEHGEVYVYHPHYWYKGVNDVLNDTHYYVYSFEKNAPEYRAESVKLTKDELNFTGKSYTVNVSGYKQIRCPVFGRPLCMFLDEEESVVSSVQVSDKIGVVNGMYIVLTIPDNATTLRLDNSEDIDLNKFDYVLLTKSDDIIDIEPDWVEHPEVLIGVYKMGLDNNKRLRSISGVSTSMLRWDAAIVEFANRNPGLSLIDYEAIKDLSNLLMVKYGCTNIPPVFGTPTTLSGTSGATNKAGMIDTEPVTTTGCKFCVDGVCTSVSNKNVLGCEGMFTERLMLKENVRNNIMNVEMPDGTIRPTHWLNGTEKYIGHIAHGKFMDIMAIDGLGSSTTFYYSSYRVTNNTNPYVVDFQANGRYNNRSGIASYCNSEQQYGVYNRTCFRGEITIENNVMNFISMINYEYRA